MKSRMVNLDVESMSPGLVDCSLVAQHEFARRKQAAYPRQRGQIFTPPSVARLMARLAAPKKPKLRILDPGAGTGTLTAALCEEILRLRHRCALELTLYEVDPAMIPLLDNTIDRCRSDLVRAGHDCTYTIHLDDFVLRNPPSTNPSLFATRDGSFDLVVMNPPYFKLPATSEHASLMQHVVHGQPNIYTLFMAAAAESLAPTGRMVAITPRSFTSGPYFREFRKWFFSLMRLKHVHIFESRREVFRDDDVLQESIITVSERAKRQVKTLSISTSHGSTLPKRLSSMRLPSTLVLDGDKKSLVLRVPTSPNDARILETLERLDACLEDQGLRVSTGPVVMFRAQEHLLDDYDRPDAVPLLMLHNVRPFETVWPLVKKGKPLAFRCCRESSKLLLPAKNYVLVRRFSAKEERRRLTASCLLEASISHGHVALENHLNYIYHARRDLTVDEAFGVAGLLNSSYYDSYLRTVSGNTQVNAADLRQLRFPDLSAIASIGASLRRGSSLTQAHCDAVVSAQLSLPSRVLPWAERALARGKSKKLKAS